VPQQLVAQILFGLELATTQQTTLKNVKPDSDPVGPTAMLGHKLDHLFVFGLGQ